jgi:hypothetical protein
MTEAAFKRGYWYAVELREFAVKLGIPSASQLRKDQLEGAIKQILRTGEKSFPASPKQTLRSPRDVDRGLRLDLAVVHYTNNKDQAIHRARSCKDRTWI